MRLESVKFNNFRNYEFLELSFAPGVNILLGENGVGKTNILEGISYLCLSQSFRFADNLDALKIGTEGFTLSGNIINSNEIIHEVVIQFDKTCKKKVVQVNKEKLKKLSLFFGLFPIVFLSPSQSDITFGHPSERRQFIDIVISQSNSKYLENLINYKKTLRQRNRLLLNKEEKEKDILCKLEPWTERLIQLGTTIISKRLEFINHFEKDFTASYKLLTDADETPFIKYIPTFEIDDTPESIESAFRKKTEESFIKERALGYSLIGPHRDEIMFMLNNQKLRTYGSQGQHKTYLIALKLAEFNYLKNMCNDPPVLLFDDVLSELDNTRSQNLLEIISNQSQVFITSTDDKYNDWNKFKSLTMRKIFIKDGKVTKIKDA